MSHSAIQLTSRSFLHFLETHGGKFRIQIGVNIAG
jgi:hypothetical protein